MRKKIMLFSLLVVIVDQFVKFLVISNLSSKGLTIINNFLSFTYIRNEGAAWNIFSGSRWFLICVSILAVFAVIKYFILDARITQSELVGYSLLLGGIVGNLIDRLFRGSVVDFIQVTPFGYDFPIFNVADSCIVVGAIIVVIHLLFNLKRGQ